MDLLQFLGHFHPVLVHLPIGILLTAILFEALSRRKGFRKLRRSVRTLLLLGFLSAVFSSITGYLLSQSGDYDADLLNMHQWLGVSVTIVCLVALILFKRKQKELRLANGVIVFVLTILIILTGHLGGSLTHGVDFLKPPPLADWFGAKPQKNRFLSLDLKAALLYKDLVAPIVNEKCSRCHGSSKQKGKLRLDQPEFILKGGKDGPVIDTSHWEESEIIRRIQLDLSDDDHMPPKEKNQLTRQEINLISYWIIRGADFKKKLNAMPAADSMISLLTEQGSTIENSDVPETTVPTPDSHALENLRKGGVAVSVLAQGKGYLSLNFMNADTSKLPSLLEDVLALRLQTLVLKFMDCRLSRGDWAKLSSMTSLIRLNLENSNIADQDLQSISVLPKLQYLNLVGTTVTLSGVEKLALVKSLNKIFLYHTRISEKDVSVLSRLFPKASIVMGDYSLPMLPSDTTELKTRYVLPEI